MNHWVWLGCLVDVGWRVLLFRFGFGMRHDATQVRILYVHVGVGSRQQWRAGETLTKLCGELELFKVGRARHMLLRGLGIVRSQFGMGVVVDLDLLEDMLFVLLVWLVWYVRLVRFVRLMRLV
jgi:hypothetical protein